MTCPLKRDITVSSVHSLYTIKLVINILLADMRASLRSHCAGISLDDFYLTAVDQSRMAEFYEGNKLLQVRAAAGSGGVCPLMHFRRPRRFVWARFESGGLTLMSRYSIEHERIHARTRGTRLDNRRSRFKMLGMRVGCY